MANTPDKVLAVALSEVGYLEKSKSAYQKDHSVLDKKTEGAGSDNYTKYGRDMHNIYPAVMDFPAFWCDCFVDWCFNKAYGITTAKSLLGGNFDDYTVASCQMYKNKNALDTTPTIGAQVFFTRNGAVSGCHHTGLVYGVDQTYFYTVEGNTSGASGVVSNGGGVAKKKYRIADYKGKVLFGHPRYDTDTNTVSSAQSSSTQSNDASIYYPKYTGNTTSITTALTSLGIDSSKTHRNEIAISNHIENYTGTYEQNLKMLELLKQGKLIRSDAIVSYYPKYSGTTTSIVTALNSLKIDSSLANRKKIAEANNISNYTGTSAQNTAMLNLLKQGKLIKYN